MPVGEIIGEPLHIHRRGSREEIQDRVKSLMGMVGLNVQYLRRYPHSFSGGQRQRIGIARALALNPELVVCDEPVSALDVSIQAQVLNLLKDLQAELGLTYLFISHNLAVIDYVADRIAVMYAGRIVEMAPKRQLFERPRHPYTETLLAAVLRPDPRLRSATLGTVRAAPGPQAGGSPGVAMPPAARTSSSDAGWRPRRAAPSRRTTWCDVTGPRSSSSRRCRAGRPRGAREAAGDAPPRPSRGSVTMGRYLVQRLLLMLPTLFLISVVTFVIIQLPPGDYLETLISDLQSSGERADLQKVEFLRQEFGLDQPLWKQYLMWVSGLVRGDMGYSFEYDRPVTDIIGERLLLTFVVSFGSILFTWLMAFPIGVYSATHQYSWGDHGLTFLGFLGLATPNFLLALILMFISFTYFGTSVGGLFSPDMQNAPWSWARVGDLLQHLWIPVIVIGTSGTAAMIRRLRANLLDELRRPYVVTARAKGLAPRRILLKYPLRIALNPFIGDIGNLLPQVISGAIIVSIVLSLPTTGPILLRALRSQDMYLAGSFLMLLATLTVIGVFLSDLALAALDPRIRQGSGQTR